MTILWIALSLVLFFLLAYQRVPLLVWAISFGGLIFIATWLTTGFSFNLLIAWIIYGVSIVFLTIRPIRRYIFSQFIFKHYSHSLPVLSQTEKQALAAGTVGWEGELFSGMPKWQVLRSYPASSLTEEELAFIAGPVKKLCEMIDNWDITHNRAKIPQKIWDFLKDNGFFGIIIPKKYNGLGFTANAHSLILANVAGKSMSVATVIAVPNSLGPAELLLHYGTLEQQEYFLPRLAAGLEIPCFALTGPEAGSDASAMPDHGIVCHGEFNGQPIIGIRLTWDKRYITLAPIATLLGLAFKLYDPDHLIGKQVSLGITCALIPTNTAGIIIGRRHYPLGSAFPNGPTQGKDVFIPLEWIIGGVKMAGTGWRMLIECLAAGRAISLPSMAFGGSIIAAYATGAYAQIRKQFHLPIGKFEGVEEALTRIAGYTYIMNATRDFTVSAIDRGEKPAVAAAISKYHVTELSRKVINDAMDIHGGKGICMGPKNYLASIYQEVPISITVEGANILTRSMIIFGQGAIRCHPYLLKEMSAIQHEDKKIGLKKFDRAIFAHGGYFLSNLVRTLLLSLTRGRISIAPKGNMKRFYQHLSRFSAALALVADIAMMVLGGNLKRKESLSARLADVFSMLYLGSAVLKKYEQNQCLGEEKAVTVWSLTYLLFNAQHQLQAVISNFPNAWIRRLLQGLIFPLGKYHQEPSDRLGHEVAKSMLEPHSLRQQLAKNAHFDASNDKLMADLDSALEKIYSTNSLELKIQQAIKEKRVVGYTYAQKIKDAAEKKVITAQEANCLLEAYHACRQIIGVDDFSPEQLEDRHIENIE